MFDNPVTLLSARDDSPSPDVDLSVVIPCLNEERTVGRCVEAAWEGIRSAGVTGEVIVADNGSTDRSRERAVAAGARIVEVPRRGYGAALQAGFLAARGRLFVMGDADMSYDFRHIPRFVETQRATDADMVVGNRFRGGIRPGAMPLSHRHIGNPLLSWTIRRLFGTPLGDCYCGLRLITCEAHRRLRMRATGMEYALEMIVQASLAGMRMAETPTTLRVDGRDVPPHLKTVRDGYRSFRFLFQHSPISVYMLPGAALIAGGAVTLGITVSREIATGTRTEGSAPILAATALVIGWLLILLGIIARMFAAGYLNSRVDPFLPRFYARWKLEHAVGAAGIVTAVAAGALIYGPRHSLALSMLGMVSLVVAVGTFFGAFVVSLMGRAVSDERFVFQPATKPGSTPKKPFSYRDAMAPADRETGQNEGHSLHTQDVLRSARNYGRWQVDAVAPAIEEATRILDVGCSLGNVTEFVADAARIHQPDARVVGLEVIPEAAALFRQRFQGRAELQVVEGDLFSPPPELMSFLPFDAAVSFNVIEHLEDDVEALRRIGALLRPGGRIGLLVPGGGERLYGTLDALDRHYRRYTPARLTARLEEAGFDVLRIRRFNLAGYFLWFFKGRIVKARRFEEGDVALFDRMVPLLRAIDRLSGPVVGQSVVAVARWNPRREKDEGAP